MESSQFSLKNTVRLLRKSWWKMWLDFSTNKQEPVRKCCSTTSWFEACTATIISKRLCKTNCRRWIMYLGRRFAAKVGEKLTQTWAITKPPPMTTDNIQPHQEHKLSRHLYKHIQNAIFQLIWRKSNRHNNRNLNTRTKNHCNGHLIKKCDK